MRTLNKNEKEYKNMEAVAKMLEAVSPNNATYEVGDCWFDYGARIMWTTIIRHGWRECQILSPVQWEMVTKAESIADIAKACNTIREGKWFSDTLKESF